MTRDGEDWYVIRIRFADLYVWSANKAQKIFLTVEHAEKVAALQRNARTVGLSYIQGLIVWAQARVGETTFLAHAEYTGAAGPKARQHGGWPKNFPRPLKYEVVFPKSGEQSKLRVLDGGLNS
jgi:hypothetical protein